MHNLVVFMEPTEMGYDISLKDGSKCFNRFCIDEDAAIELLGVHYLKKIKTHYERDGPKGKWNLLLQ